MRYCEQTKLHGEVPKPAEVYAMDTCPGGWGGYYCRDCAQQMRFQVTDVLNQGEET